MTATSAALSGRALAASLQQDACTIVRPSAAAPTMNEVTGALTYPAGTTIYTGACRVRSEPAARAMRVEAEERRIAIRTYLVSVPVVTSAGAAVDVQVDDVVTVTASPLDPAMVGRALTVADVTRGSHITARRLVCIENDS